MSKPRISLAMSWEKYEKAVQGVFSEALQRLAGMPELPRAEIPLNLEVYWIAHRVHQEQFLAGKCLFDFTIHHDSTNPPEPDDSALSARLRKRPDFVCVIKDMQAKDFRRSQVSYGIECKRLGRMANGLEFNDLYSEKGISRFMTDEHEYAKGCPSASMVGYLQDMDPDTVFDEVVKFAKKRAIPSLVKAAIGWATKSVTLISQPPLDRTFSPGAPIKLHHYWVDLRHCKFTVPSASPPQSAADIPTAVPTRKPSKKPTKPAVQKPAAKKRPSSAATKPKRRGK